MRNFIFSLSLLLSCFVSLLLPLSLFFYPLSIASSLFPVSFSFFFSMIFFFHKAFPTSLSFCVSCLLLSVFPNPPLPLYLNFLVSSLSLFQSLLLFFLFHQQYFSKLYMLMCSLVLNACICNCMVEKKRKNRA